MKIIRHAEVREGRDTSREFTWVDDPSAGFSFICAADGTPVLSFPEARKNWDYVQAHMSEFVDRGIVVRSWTYVEPAVGKCVCGREVQLDGFTCPCDCGRDYNSAGQLLAAREQWGEETGEHPADIMRIR